MRELQALTETEQSCLQRYLDRLVETLAAGLEQVIVFGSVARNDPWPRGMPIRSDLDLLVITTAPLATEVVDELIDATLPLFLECGRQIGPQFRTREQLAATDDRTLAFVENVERDGIPIYPGSILEPHAEVRSSSPHTVDTIANGQRRRKR